MLGGPVGAAVAGHADHHLRVRTRALGTADAVAVVHRVHVRSVRVGGDGRLPGVLDRQLRLAHPAGGGCGGEPDNRCCAARSRASNRRARRRFGRDRWPRSRRRRPPWPGCLRRARPHAVPRSRARRRAATWQRRRLPPAPGRRAIAAAHRIRVIDPSPEPLVGGTNLPPIHPPQQPPRRFRIEARGPPAATRPGTARRRCRSRPGTRRWWPALVGRRDVRGERIGVGVRRGGRGEHERDHDAEQRRRDQSAQPRHRRVDAGGQPGELGRAPPSARWR